MGNSSSKDSHNPGRRSSEPASPSLPSSSHQQAGHERLVAQIYGQRQNGSGSRRSSRHDLSFLHLGRNRGEDQPQQERVRETRQEKEARRTERERQARLKERERSMQEEHVDGGYLVTLGTYIGPEDYSKPVVRQLQIERRLAPFWKGLENHESSWTEHQLVAAARGLPIPAADEIPPEMARSTSNGNNPRGSDVNINHLTIPINSRSQSYQSDRSNSGRLDAVNSGSGTSSSGPGQLFRGRAKTLASLATGSKSQSPDLTPQEIRLPQDPCVNGLPIEAYLYREPSECPICFLYYPPYLNKTRCCDQPICSECFVQIKRPDPHPPEHEQPGEERPPEEEAEMLVSEVASCPFCVTPEFGITYEPPPFRRGLAYAKQTSPHPLTKTTSATSSQTSLPTGGRRRTTSISATASQVITTDRVRPDWAKKLSDARAHALRRSAAATALHNAAYMLGGNQAETSSRGAFGRRRRTFFGDSPGASGSGTPREETESGADIAPDRTSSRRGRVQDLEDLMMMEAIRLSLAAEDERKRKEEKGARKEGKKRAKEAKKEAKAADKAARKSSGSNQSLYPVGSNDSSTTWATSSMARSTSNLGQQPSIPEEEIHGKGKAPAQDFAGFNPITEATSTLNTELRDTDPSNEPGRRTSGSPPGTSSAARHLEASRANLQPSASSPIPMPSPLQQKEPSNTSSTASSFNDSTAQSPEGPSAGGSALDVSTPDGGADTPQTSPEPLLNFRSLAAMIGEEEEKNLARKQSEHIEDADQPRPVNDAQATLRRNRGDSGESSSSSQPPPPSYSSDTKAGDEDEIQPLPRVVPDVESKNAVDVNVLDRSHGYEATH
ncbi:hypothetical protein Q7P37_004812 [Cladosporium fusiforme]